MKKTIEERKLRESKEIEANSLKDMVGDLTTQKDRQSQSVETSMPLFLHLPIDLSYQRYLESVVESAGHFGEVKDLIARYDTLFATNNELLERARDAQERTEQYRNSFILSSEEKNNTLLNYNNTIAKLQTRLEESQRKSSKRQSEWEHTLKSATQKTLLHGQIKMYSTKDVLTHTHPISSSLARRLQDHKQLVFPGQATPQ